jgi:hypothetical protein
MTSFKAYVHITRPARSRGWRFSTMLRDAPAQGQAIARPVRVQFILSLQRPSGM